MLGIIMFFVMVIVIIAVVFLLSKMDEEYDRRTTKVEERNSSRNAGFDNLTYDDDGVEITISDPLTIEKQIEEDLRRMEEI